MSEFLVVSALGTDQPGIINKLSKVASEHGCNIQDTRMTVLGGEFALLMLISGELPQIEGLERDLPSTANQLGLTTQLKRTKPRTNLASARPYEAQVVALDNPGIVHEIARFFSDHAINIEEMQTSTYAAPHTGTPMFSLCMTVNIPSSTKIKPLKEEFIHFCDDRNLDATIEPRM